MKGPRVELSTASKSTPRPFPMADYGDDDDMEGMTYHDRLEFWGVEVPPNKVVNIEFSDTDEELIHLTQARSARNFACSFVCGKRAAWRQRRDLGQVLCWCTVAVLAFRTLCRVSPAAAQRAVHAAAGARSSRASAGAVSRR